MTIRAVLFDRDLTLLHINPQSVIDFGNQLDQILPGASVALVQQAWADWEGPWPKVADEEDQFWDVFWMAFGASYLATPAALVALKHIGAFYHTWFRPFDDVAACLEQLRNEGYALGVLTNFALPSVGSTLASAGIDPSWFSVLLSSGAIGARKPDPYAYQVALDGFGIQPTECAFVDDEPANVEAARSLGMLGLLIDRSGTQKGDTISGLHEVYGRIVQGIPAE